MTRVFPREFEEIAHSSNDFTVNTGIKDETHVTIAGEWKKICPSPIEDLICESQRTNNDQRNWRNRN
jgi:hypothetical protein